MAKIIRRRPRPVVDRRPFPRLPLALHIHRIHALQPRRHRQQLPQRDLLLALVLQREILLRQILRRHHPLIQPMRKQLRILLQQNARRHCRECLAAGRQFRQCLPIPTPEIPFIHQIPVPHHQQAAMLRGLLGVLEGFVQLLHIQPGLGLNRGGILQRAPAPLRIGRRKVVLRSIRRAGNQGNQQK